MSRDTTENKNKDLAFEDLRGKMDPVLDAEVREKLISARVGLLLKAPFFGSMATRLELVNSDEWLDCTLLISHALLSP